MSKKYLYILKNKLMPAYCKIGISDNVESRAKALYGEWRIYRKFEVENASYYESMVKQRMQEFRASGYEMFNCPVSYLEKIVIEELERPIKINIPEDATSFKIDMKSIAYLVRKTRKEQGLTQPELAGASGTGVRLIVDIEKGKETCEIGKVLHILMMLGIKLYISE